MPLNQRALASPGAALQGFEEFLESDVYLAYCQHRHATAPADLIDDELDLALLDVVERWLVDGNGLDVCPTYEVFLRVVINLCSDIIWTGERIGDAPVWPTSAPTRKVSISLNGGSLPDRHPIIDRHVFEMEQARRAAERNTRLDALLRANGL